MSPLRRRDRGHSTATTVSGPVRAHTRISELLRKARPGDVLVVDMMDVDRLTASKILSCEPAAVLNVASSISGRFPNRGPELMAQAQLTHLDQVDRELLSVADGTTVTVVDGEVRQDSEVIASGRVLDADTVAEQMTESAPGMTVQLEAFTANAMDHVARDARVLLDGDGLPDAGVELAGKPVLIVDAGFDWESDLASIKPFIKRRALVIIATSRVADRVRDIAGPAAVIVGDPGDAREETLQKSAHVLVHGANAVSNGVARLESLGISHAVHDSEMADVNLAILVAHAQGAEVIVTAGVPSRLLDYIDDGADDAAGTFLARLQVGARLLDASAVASVYKAKSQGWAMTAVVMVAAATLALAVWVSPDAREWVDDVVSAATSWLGALR